MKECCEKWKNRDHVCPKCHKPIVFGYEPIEELPNDSFRCEHPWDALFLKLNEVIRAINKR